jgi:putative membrane protein
MKTTKLKTVLILINLLIVAFLFTISCNNPQKSGDASMAGDTKPDSVNSANNANDAKFLAKAAQINMEEIKLGELAQQNSSMRDIKQLGEMMQTDHQKAQDQLTALAAKKSIPLPTSLDDNAEADYKKLAAISGTGFDKEYCDMMVNGHKDALAMFRKESTEAADSAIRQWASSLIPSLQNHLDHATDCQKKCNNAM